MSKPSPPRDPVEVTGDGAGALLDALADFADEVEASEAAAATADVA